MVGGKKQTLEAFVPGTTGVSSACYGAFPTALNGGGPSLPFLLNPTAQYDATTKVLFVCGKNYFTLKFECYSLAQSASSWTLITFTSTSSTFTFATLPSLFVSFTYNKQMWIVGDDTPRVLDLVSKKALDFWDNAANPPTISNNRIDGSGCAVVVGDFVYLFGGSDTPAVRRMYLKGLGVPAGSPVNPIPDGTRKWENLAFLPAGITVSAACNTIATNRNQIFVQIDSTTSNGLIYDIYQNTFTMVPYTVDFLGGTPVNEICHDNLLYAFPLGIGAKTFSPALTSWLDVPSTGSLNAARYNPSVVAVASQFFASPPFTTLNACAGC